MRRLTSCALLTTAVATLLAAGWAKLLCLTPQWRSPGLSCAFGTGSATGAASGTTVPADVGIVTVIDAATVTSSSATSPPDTYNIPCPLRQTGPRNRPRLLGFRSVELHRFDQRNPHQLLCFLLTNTFTGSLTQSLPLGSYVYTVTIDPTQTSLPAGAASSTLLDAFVTVTHKQRPTGTITPEPTSLVLGADDVLGLFIRRRLVG